MYRACIVRIVRVCCIMRERRRAMSEYCCVRALYDACVSACVRFLLLLDLFTLRRRGWRVGLWRGVLQQRVRAQHPGDGGVLQRTTRQASV